jgi:raffinose/stachyose/melibiose transport system permease protein
MRESTTTKIKRQSTNSIAKRETLESYLMITPMLIGFALFTIYPMLWLIRWSWFRYDGMSTPRFIGVDNFVRVFARDKEYWRALLNTFIIAGSKVCLEVPLALFLAVALSSKKRINAFFRAIFFSPSIVSTAVVGIVFFLMFDPFNGSINLIFRALHLIQRNVNWFGDKLHADLVIVLASVWRGFGINMIFFIMGLQNIPLEIYECASLDGVNTWTRFTRITLPMLAPVFKVVMMLFIVNAMKISDLVLVLTNGQPGGATEVVMSYAFKYFFSYGNADALRQYGYSSAIAIVTAIIIGIIVGTFFKATKKVGDYY